MKTRNEKRKAVILIKDGKVLHYESLYKAAKELNSIPSNINAAAVMGRTVKGWQVFFEEDLKEGRISL